MFSPSKGYFFSYTSLLNPIFLASHEALFIQTIAGSFPVPLTFPSSLLSFCGSVQALESVDFSLNKTLSFTSYLTV